ncbi:MAG: hypothetical protein V1792_02530 [Pseudomonadota bacterium]
MDQSSSSAHVYRSLLWVIVFCGALAFGVVRLRTNLVPFFMTQPYMNGAIVALGLFAMLLSILGLLRLLVQSNRMDSLAGSLQADAADSEKSVHEIVKSVGGGFVTNRCLRTLELIRRGPVAVSDSLTLLSDADLDSEEARGVFVRYLIGVMVFLGLIGTFWGVLLTVGGVQKVLAALDPARMDDPTLFVTQLKQSMGGLLGGLSTAFSTSLFGLGGSVAVGFVDVQTRRARSCVLADLDRFVVTRLLPAGAAEVQAEAVLSVPRPPLRAVPVQTVTQGPEPAGGDLYIVASQEALAENLRRLTDVISDQSAMDEKVADSLVELKGMLETLREEEILTREGIYTANQLRQGMLERMDNLGRQVERFIKETRLHRDESEDMGKALLDRMKLEGEITNKTLSMGFSDLVRRLDPARAGIDKRGAPQEDAE